MSFPKGKTFGVTPNALFLCMSLPINYISYFIHFVNSYSIIQGLVSEPSPSDITLSAFKLITGLIPPTLLEL